MSCTDKYIVYTSYYCYGRYCVLWQNTIPIGMTMDYTYVVYCVSMDTIIALYSAVIMYRQPVESWHNIICNTLAVYIRVTRITYKIIN